MSVRILTNNYVTKWMNICYGENVFLSCGLSQMRQQINEINETVLEIWQKSAES